jgi:hypothetical protein
MAQYIVTAPDGKEITLEGPSGASQADVIAQAQKLYQPTQSQPQVQKTPEIGNMYTQSAEDIQYSPEGIPLNTSSYGSAPTGATKSAQQALTSTVSLPINVATGIAKSPAALAQLVGKYFGTNAGDIPVNAINQIEKGTQAQMGDVGSAVNQVGSAVGQAAPFMGAGTVGMIPSFAQRVAQGTGMGVLSGTLTPEQTGLSPEDFANAKAQNIGIQSAIGGAFPVVGNVLKTGYNAAKSLVEPLNTTGREAIIGRALREFAGNDAEKAIANLKSYENLVKGSNPTVAEVAGVPSLAALQRTATNVSPEATNALALRQEANALARTNALENIATPTRIAKYQDIRSRVAEDLYSDALKPIDLGKLTPKLTSEVASLVKTPAINKAMGQAQENAANRGINIADPAGSMRGLHETKMALDDQIAKVKALAEKNGGAKSAELNSLETAKTRLLGFMEQVSPEYKTARKTYERLSQPVEQLTAIESIAGKSLNPKDYSVYLSRFSNELEKAKKEGLLSETQLGRLENIKQDLMRTDFAATAGKPPGTNTVQNLAYGNMLNQLNLPNLLRRHGLSETVSNIGARIGDVVYGKANKEIANQLAETLLNPKQAASYMEAVKVAPQGIKMTAEEVKKMEKANLAKLLLMQSAGQAAQ